MRAFTLAETVVVVAIVGVVGVALTGALANFYKQNAYVFESSTSLDNSRRALLTSLGNLREATYGEDGAYPILAAATSSITFHADIDADGPVEKVRLYLANGTFYRAVTNSAGNPPSYTGQPETTATVVAYVKNATSTPIFRFYDSAGTELTSPYSIGDIAQISVRVDTDLNPNRAPDIFTLTGRATLRNLMNL